MHLKASNLFPPPGLEVSLVCTIIKDGELEGPVQFYRMSTGGSYSRFAHLLQKPTGCINKIAPAGYKLICGVGTENVFSRKQEYTLQIDSVQEADYTRWYCYQELEDYISQNISLAPYRK